MSDVVQMVLSEPIENVREKIMNDLESSLSVVFLNEAKKKATVVANLSNIQVAWQVQAKPSRDITIVTNSSCNVPFIEESNTVGIFDKQFSEQFYHKIFDKLAFEMPRKFAVTG